MSKKKVSIIVPVYNGEKYLNIFLDSILQQTYNNIEVVFINDQSKDNSFDLLKKYQKQYKFIKVLNQKNGGQAVARNNGIKEATGEYITFADQDDYLDSNYIETLVGSIKSNDILITGYKRVDEQGNVLYKKIPVDGEWAKYKFCSSWSKLYNTDFIKKNNIQFGKYKIGEDVYFLLQACSMTDKISVLTYAGYNNLRNFSSVSNNINLKKGNNKLMPMLEDMVKNINFSNFDKDLLLYFFLKTVVHYIYNQRKNCSIKEYYAQFNDYFAWLTKIYMQYNKKIRLIWQKEEEFKINILINAFIIFKKMHCVKILLFFIKILTPKTNK